MKDETKFILHLVLVAFSILIISMVQLSIIPFEKAQNVVFTGILLGALSTRQLYKLLKKDENRTSSTD